MMQWLRRGARQGDALGLNGLGYSILSGLDGSYDYRQACTWLLLAVERSPPGDLHNRAVVNLHAAEAQLSPAEIASAERAAALWRGIFQARQSARAEQAAR